MVLFLKSIAHPPLFVKYFAHMQNRPAAKLTGGSRRPSSSQQFFFAKRFLRIIISSARRVPRCGRYNKVTPSVSLRSTAPPIPPQKNTASFFGGPGEGAKGINAALASQIMAQAGFPCARALNLCIPALKPRGKIFASAKRFSRNYTCGIVANPFARSSSVGMVSVMLPSLKFL